MQFTIEIPGLHYVNMTMGVRELVNFPCAGLKSEITVCTGSDYTLSGFAAWKSYNSGDTFFQNSLQQRIEIPEYHYPHDICFQAGQLS